MEKKKLITALMLCCMAVLPAVATTYTNVQDITTGVSNDSGTNGGAVYNTLTGATISGTSETDKIEFGNNTAVNGGAVYNDGSSASITITNTTFSKNTSTNQTGGGGAIYNNGGTINIGGNVSFTNNHIGNIDSESEAMSAGGAIASWNGGSINITGDNVVFKGNGTKPEGTDPSWASGGAIYIDCTTEAANLDIDGATFQDNMAAMGGAVYVGGTTATIDNAVFKGNTTDYGNGGAIYSYGGYNYAGGGSDVDTSLTITDTQFNENISGYKGGAIHNQAHDGIDDSVITIIDSSFTGNRSNALDDGTGGGAIFNQGKTNVTNTTFTGNVAKQEGGAIFNNTGTTTVTGGSFSSNTAATNGGAIYNNAALKVSGTTFTGNSATEGGAIYNAADATANLTNVIVGSSNAVSGATDSIYNAGKVTTSGTNTFYSDTTIDGELTYKGTNTVDGNIDGTGSIINEGTTSFGGDNSGFTGTYTQDASTPNAETTVTGTFFGGKSAISGGILNWETNKALAENASLEVTGGNLNIGSSDEGGNTGIFNVNNSTTIADAVSVNINQGSTLNINGTTITGENPSSAGSVTLGDGDRWNGAINLSEEGTLNLSGVAQGENATLAATDGTLNLTGQELNIGAGSSIADAVVTNIGSGSTVNITGDGSVSLGSDDTWNGDITLGGNGTEGGSLTLSGVTQGTDATLAATDGTLNLPNQTLNIGASSSIADAVVTNIGSGSTVNITDTGSVSLGSDDTWNGSITLDDSGSLALSGVDQGTDAILSATKGSLALTGQELTIGAGSSIADAVVTNIGTGTTVNITDTGSVALGNDDQWNGSIVMDGGNLALSDITTAALKATGGTITMDNVTLGQGTSIDKDVKVTSDADSGPLVIGNGIEFAYDDNDNLEGGINLNGGILDYAATDPDLSTKLAATSGKLNLIEGSYLTITNPSSVADAVVVDIQDGATLEVDTGAKFNLNGATAAQPTADQWNGLIVNNGGTVTANNISNSATGALEQENGTTNIKHYSTVNLGNASSVSGGTINVTDNSILNAIDASVITGGDMVIDNTSKFTSNGGGFVANNITASGMFDVMNGSMDAHTATVLNVGDAEDSQLDFTFDVYGRSDSNKGSDSFAFTNINKGSGVTGDTATINISDWNLGGDIYGWDAPIDRHIDLGNIFSGTIAEDVEFTSTDKEIHTPIGYYQLNNHGGLTGNYTLDLARFDGPVFRGQVATVAQWMNQLAIDDMLFTHSMVLPSFKEEDGGTASSGVMANRYAATSPMFAPYQYSRKDGGLWYKMYGNFENLQMNNGLKVGNNSYGALIGADFGLKELKHGWKFMPTAYIGYNGAHQTFANMGAYQNGGQAGFLGTFYKNNFIVAGLVYGGVYDNSMDVAGHTENTFNYFAGAATKAAYNIRLHRDWVLQPNIMAAYNFFGQQNWHSDYGQMGMMAGMLHGVNIAPGVNLIWEKDTFSAYITLQYMYNVNGAVGGRAGNVDLPHMEMERGYIQYGIGFTKKFTDRASGYLQAVLRNVGRTGAGFQLGFNYFLGK